MRSDLKARVVEVFARRAVTAVFLLLAAHCSLLTASAQYAQPPVGPRPTGKSDEVLKQVGIEQRLGNQVPLGMTFRDESGREVKLGDYFKNGKPVVLMLVYYDCPMLCNQVLNGVVGTLEAVTFTPGKEFEIVTVSFDPREGPELAAKKKETYLKRYRRENAGVGWHFLTGDKASVDALSESVGFRYVWDDESKQFAHASAIMVATPGGRLSHYFYGIDYSPKDLRLALVEASEGKVGSPVDALLLYCYHYDPATGRFSLVMGVLRVLGVLTVLGLAAFIYYLTRRARRKDERWEEEINVGA